MKISFFNVYLLCYWNCEVICQVVIRGVGFQIVTCFLGNVVQVWTIGPGYTRNLSPFVQISRRTMRLAGKSGVLSTTNSKKTRL